MTLDRILVLEVVYGSALVPWLLGMSLVCCCETWVTVQLLKKYVTSSQSSLRSVRFSHADLVTFGRGAVIACVAGFLLLPRPSGWYAWMPGVLYLLAVLADYVDGYLARLHNSTSEFGAALDRTFDGIITLVGSLLGIHYGHLPVWYFAVGIAFFVFSLAIWIRKKSGRVVLDLPSSNYRRVVGGSNVFFIGVALTPALPVDWFSLLAAFFTFLLITGFFLDWQYVTGNRK
jgi:CDP-diacylglycerol--glycerol-3-phosphate 3-phosphatidyltransferase